MSGEGISREPEELNPAQIVAKVQEHFIHYAKATIPQSERHNLASFLKDYLLADHSLDAVEKLMTGFLNDHPDTFPNSVLKNHNPIAVRGLVIRDRQNKHHVLWWPAILTVHGDVNYAAHLAGFSYVDALHVGGTLVPDTNGLHPHGVFTFEPNWRRQVQDWVNSYQ